MQMRIFLLMLVDAAIAPFNEPWDFVIGAPAPPNGAVLLREDMSQLDLAKDCGRGLCPSVLVFDSQQWGTISVVNCLVGRKYLFVNKSRVDLGIVIQQSGGRFGSKAIGKYDVASCFCLDHDARSDDYDDIDTPETGDHRSGSGVLLCR